MTHLHFPRAVVGRELVHEDDGRAGASLLVIELHPIIGHSERHGFPPELFQSISRSAPTRPRSSRARSVNAGDCGARGRGKSTLISAAMRPGRGVKTRM